MTRLLIAYIITSTPFINPRQTRAKRLRSGLWAAFFRPVLVLVQMDVGWCCMFPQPDVGAWQRPCGVNAVSLSLSVSLCLLLVLSTASLTNVQTTVQPLLPEQVV